MSGVLVARLLVALGLLVGGTRLAAEALPEPVVPQPTPIVLLVPVGGAPSSTASALPTVGSSLVPRPSSRPLPEPSATATPVLGPTPPRFETQPAIATVPPTLPPLPTTIPPIPTPSLCVLPPACGHLLPPLCLPLIRPMPTCPE